ncbi:MAG: hypothetical protein WC412_08740 [Candidatus Omnitrophota bacterium]|jgi:hypothetical protein
MIWLNTILSGIAVIISFIVLWLTYLRRGMVKMTQPSLIAFVPENNSLKICLQTLLFSTSYKGNVIENVWIKLQNKQQCHCFTLWAYRGKGGGEIIKGSGLFISREGVPTMHYFMLNAFKQENIFIEDDIKLKVYCDIINCKYGVLLGEIELAFNKEHIDMLQKGTGILFDWNPTVPKYTPCISKPFDRTI